MSLQRATKHAYARQILERGGRYARDGHVHDSYGCETGVHAMVAGASRDVYAVALHVEGDVVYASCECPYAEGGDACKHMWAVTVEADREGLLVVSGRRLRLVVERHDHEEVDLDDEDGVEVLSVRPAATAARVLRRPQQPGWEAALAALGESTAANHEALPARPRVIEYVLDLDGEDEETAGADGVQVSFFERPWRKDGTPGKRRAVGFERRRLDELPEAADREALSVLLSAERPLDTLYFSPWNRATPQDVRTVRIPGALVSGVLPRVLATGRCGVLPADAGADAPLEVLSWDDGPPWQIALHLRRARGLRVTASLVRDGERVETGAVGWVGHGVARVGARLGPASTELSALWDILRGGEITVPSSGEERLWQSLAGQASRPQLTIDRSVGWRVIAAEATPRIRFERPGAGARELVATIELGYGGAVVPGGSAGWAACDTAGRRLVERDRAAERALLDPLRGAGLSATTGSRWDARVRADRFGAAVRVLLAAGWHVEAEGNRIRRGGQTSVRVRSGIDWFDLHGAVDFDGVQAPLSALLAAVRRGQDFVVLDDGSRGMIPEAWLGRNAAIARLAEDDGERLRFRRSQVGLLDALLAAQPAPRVDARFRQVRRQLHDFDGVRPASAPAGFRGALREYQRTALGWFQFLERFGLGGCLADDMGLGKTVQILALLERRRTRRGGKGQGRTPSLVVVPRSLVSNWLDEAAKFAPKLRVIAYHGPQRRQLRDEMGACDVIVTTYGVVRLDIEHLAAMDFDYVILDEAQAIKNASSKAARACRLLPAHHRLALTGTPVENHLGDLLSLFEFLNPGMLGAAGLAERLWSGKDDPEGRALLARVLRPFILRRTKEQVLPELPAKTVQTLPCALDRAQRRDYDQLRAHIRAALQRRIEDDGLGRAKIAVLEGLLRLRQAACHPGLIDRDRAGESSAKLATLLEHLQEVAEAGHKALVFSQFTTFLGIVRDRLDQLGIAYEYLDGRTRQRGRKVERFQTDPGCQVFLISLKAGGHGLNLTAADYVFLLDPWWNPAVEAQAIDRAHRMGQTRPVFAYRLVASNTVEEAIMQLQDQKRQLADALIGADNSVLADLTAADLTLLFG